MNEEKEYLKEEIRKEFQLDRMILFSDAVFAIVITLMAIEIHVPELARNTEPDIIIHELIKLIPNIFSYGISFFFIGHIWYQHLQLFSLLKDYDKGLVIRNLFMLFFIGLFPFSAALMVRLNSNFPLPLIIYCSTIFICKVAQLLLHHYVLFKRPNLRLKTSIHEDIIRFKKSRLTVILFGITFILIISTYQLISDPELKPIGIWWFFLLPIALKIFKKRVK